MKQVFHVGLILNLALCLFMLPSIGLSSDLSLSQFLAQVEELNLSLQVSQSELKKATAEASGLRLPSPQVGVTRMDMSDGNQANGWEVSQQIPFPGKVSQDYRMRKYQREARDYENKGQVLAVRSQARLVYFLVWRLQEEQAVLEEKKKLLQSHLQITRSLSRSSTFAKVHLLKVESEVDQVEVAIEKVRLQQRLQMSVAAQLLDQDPRQFTFRALDPGLMESPSAPDVERAPQILALQSEVRSRQAESRMLSQSWFPDLNLKYNSMQAGAMFPEFTQISVGISLPFVFFWQADAEQIMGQQQSLQAKLNLQQEKRRVQGATWEAEISAQSLRRQLTLLNDETLPRARRNQKLFQNIAPRDLSSLQEHLSTVLSVPDLKLQILQLRTEHEMAVIEILKYQNRDTHDHAS